AAAASGPAGGGAGGGAAAPGVGGRPAAGVPGRAVREGRRFPHAGGGGARAEQPGAVRRRPAGEPLRQRWAMTGRRAGWRKATVAVVCRVAVLLVTAPRTAWARLLPNWPYEKLFKEADLVVIAEATAVADSGEKAKLGGWNAEFIGMNTTFTPRHVIKG